MSSTAEIELSEQAARPAEAAPASDVPAAPAETGTSTETRPAGVATVANPTTDEPAPADAKITVGLPHKESHSTGGDLIKSMIFGGLDGIINSESTVSAVFGARLGPRVLNRVSPELKFHCRRWTVDERRSYPWLRKPYRGRHLDGPGRLPLVQG